MTFALEYVIAGVIVVAMVVYLLSGGADFGGGIWDMLAFGPRKKAQRRALSDAIAPIWEANHVWLIVVVVLLFVCFPRAFSTMMIALHIPLTLMLIGIVLRGSAFAFQSYSAGATRLQRRSGVVFAAASFFTPFMLGISAGAIAAGEIHWLGPGRVETDYISEWLAPFPFVIGAFTLAICAFISAVYMTVEVDDADLKDDFRIRALWTAVAVGACAFAAIVLARDDAPLIWDQLVTSTWAIPFQAATGIAAVTAIWALFKRRYRLARLAAMAQVGLIVVGWGFGQFPYLVYPDITIANSAAPEEVLLPVTVALGIGMVILIPSFWYLYRVFKVQRGEDTDRGGFSPPTESSATGE
ncbi:cytochrome d ubiquinol oxidase subunit II [Persicimonas caeni]|uniref:Cytochrome d ubiquinol oxidase subunit II n=1 Tax=Persicimonas caeni TaxID=2292766 RepID=A0A4Y6PY45_PERCE|nr:cytochrome d ubiquinol oxidase subunit II [Persicimonas caeni]QDG53252.1 cytochrome d ubiquinol oxidase subunit II [Persicimonas caeni]QED34474.1 cytochrome d ubiquinol oxidase subunit II [Persicimonas caeni]